MKKVLIAIIIILIGFIIFRSCSDGKNENFILQENSMLIQQQIENVSKLIVTEGHFAEVYNYKDSKELFGPLLTAEKKALVVVNADVTIAYDLSKLTFKLDEESKTLYLEYIPEPEISLNPDFEYYDVTADYLNPFDAGDYNAIKHNVKSSLLQKVEASSLKSNAKNRLLSELQKLLILTHSMGWKLSYNSQTVNDFNELKVFAP
ncbi:DUF4230 domain-containing protein [Maribacter sp. 2210JD10-5]|uniref:DUF4230 domain-containing protein n=1 Tax=Maribacter sp. 2210JD10-5 TaxID=3386272 RepID=UPI0039BC4451